MDPKLKEFEEQIGINFSNKELLRESLTHRSYLNENPSWDVPHNERLEFLGDAVLELAVTENLFHSYPDYTEGDLTSIRAALVNYQILSKIAGEIGMEDKIYLSKGEAKDSNRAKEVILANAIEAVIGAIYLDQGYKITSDFIKKNVLHSVPQIIKTKSYKDPKSSLQEIIQEKLKITPSYEVLSEEGPDHQKIFTVAVYFSKEFGGEGKGYSKQEAEVEAAKNALNKLDKLTANQTDNR